MLGALYCVFVALVAKRQPKPEQRPHLAIRSEFYIDDGGRVVRPFYDRPQ